MEDLIKNIILKKSYFELTSSEQKSIQEWASNEEEFDALKAVLMATQSMADQSKVKPSSSVKQRLDDRFAAKHAGQNVTLWSKFLLFFFPKNTQFFKKPAFQLAMVALIVILLIPFLWQERTAQYAMNEGQRKLEVEKVQKDRIEERDSNKEAGQSPDEADHKIVNEIKDIVSEQIEDPLVEDSDLEEEKLLMDEVVTYDEQADFALEEVEVSSPVYEEMEELVERSAPQSAMSREKTSDFSLSKSTSKSKVETSETISLLTALY